MLEKKTFKNDSFAITVLVCTILSLSIITTSYYFQSSHAQQQQQRPSITDSSTINTVNTLKIQVGGGNKTAPYTTYSPGKIDIKIGQSVNFYNPTTVAEPHTVTFVLDNSSKAGLDAMFSVKNSTKFTPIPPNSNSQPVVMSNNSSKDTVNILGSNARASNSVAIDSSGKVIQLGHNAVYKMKGDEKYINSGLLFPKGMGPPDGTTSFTVSFDEAGTYNYYCILHPWQKGTIIVK
jgi:plastocyanin